MNPNSTWLRRDAQDEKDERFVADYLEKQGMKAVKRDAVVLDLDFIRSKPYGLPRILQDLRFAVTGGSHIADQIEAQIKPPKPPEPQGLGAVVEDTAGRLYVRVDDPKYPWRDNGSAATKWREFDAVRVLSEGVQP